MLAEALLPESAGESQTQFVDDLGAMVLSGGDFRVEPDDETGGGAVSWQLGVADKDTLTFWGTAVAPLSEDLSHAFRLSHAYRPRLLRVIPSRAVAWVMLDPLATRDFTWSFSAAPFVTVPATGRNLADYLRNAWDAITFETANPTEEASVPLDIAATLQQARSQAGLPVQDLAAMFGVKRRQLYNLMSGEATPDPTRERRIARVTEAISRLSEHANGNSKNVRGALLARIDGDSVYDAAVSDDVERLYAATDRALEAIGGGVAARDRIAPSNRATSAEAAAVREFLRATRDESRRPSEP